MAIRSICIQWSPLSQLYEFLSKCFQLEVASMVEIKERPRILEDIYNSNINVTDVYDLQHCAEHAK